MGKHHGICFGSQGVEVENPYLLGGSTTEADNEIGLIADALSPGSTRLAIHLF
jgi:hypothetical protein